MFPMNRKERLEVIVNHGGYVDKHIGDAVMALWGKVEAYAESLGYEYFAHFLLALQRWFASKRSPH